MMQKINVLKNTDYEKYEIVMPFTALIGKRRNHFLCSELEKLHPCFSDEYAYDTKLKRISKKGFFSDVFVINKYKLAEYEGKRTLSGLGFFINDSKNKNAITLSHRIFMNTRWKLTGVSVFLCLLIGFAGLLSGILVRKRNFNFADSYGKKSSVRNECIRFVSK